MNWNRWVNALRRAIGSLQTRLGSGQRTPEGKRTLELGSPRLPLVRAPAYARIPKK